MLLQQGERLNSHASHTEYRIKSTLGGGAQGEVYLAESNDRTVALKWYFRHMATQEQRRILDQLIRLGPPDSRFLWPEETIDKQGKPGFGYVMPLRDSGYSTITDLLRGTVSPSYQTLVTAAYELVDAFYQLHSGGLSYRDINDGGVFFDFDEGKVLICDNDNVYIDGLGDAGVKGKMRWMAPEIVRGDVVPSRDTDLFSLSVFLFFLFVAHHPLEGKRESAIKCFDIKAMTKLYGKEPIFIFDPEDDSNRPDPRYHTNAIALWPNYPRYLQRLFVRSFTDGVHDPSHGRVGENEWRKALITLRDSLFHCDGCGAEAFYDGEVVREQAGVMQVCRSCRRVPASPARIKIEDYDGVVMLEPGVQLFAHHLEDQAPFKFTEALAEVVAHSQDPRQLGLKNLSNERWVVTKQSGDRLEVDPGRTARIAPNLKIHFGQRHGQLRV